MAKKNNIDTTIIGHDIYIKGEVHALGPILVEGRVEGSMVSKSYINIGENAVVKADLVANEIVVDGEVQGNVEALEGIKINKRFSARYCSCSQHISIIITICISCYWQ